MTALPDSELARYRPAVGIMLLNRAGNVFVGRRVDMRLESKVASLVDRPVDPGRDSRCGWLDDLQVPRSQTGERCAAAIPFNPPARRANLSEDALCSIRLPVSRGAVRRAVVGRSHARRHAPRASGR